MFQAQIIDPAKAAIATDPKLYPTAEAAWYALYHERCDAERDYINATGLCDTCGEPYADGDHDDDSEEGQELASRAHTNQPGVYDEGWGIGPNSEKVVYRVQAFDPDFDSVYTLDADNTLRDAIALYAPEVNLSEERDVDVTTGWGVLTGHTGQYGYNGAVMHPSEQWGDWAIEDLHHHRGDAERIAFAIVEVRDQDGDLPDGDPIGWAVAYKPIAG